ncbi:HAD family hydrolase [Promicromonospora thailandica]|uniref:Hydrolase of the HAD superfamily n=1 Tax=Promicromonospora thailandica TaxID=765201 RepID=A0A9X2JU11_9MICO|nr:HAD family hydrolase [Promicromonospora thailandica]MCP2262967.1 putative hydrolase of the HAD superfamily [Promicromonospora thailandica]BFF18328.1 HAD family hydrolase [Promicromonospora thailandica]
MLKVVLFDLDDTLVDQEGASRAALLDWFPELGLDLDDPDELVAAWGAVSEEAYARYQRREITFLDQRRVRVREFLGADATDAEADELFAGYLSRYERAWRAFDDAGPTLRRVRDAGLVVALLTNGDGAHQRLKLERTGLAGHIDMVVASSDLPAGKPDPRAYSGACDILGVAPDTVLMVGDDVQKDYLGPLDAGLGAVLLDRADRHPEVEHRIRTLTELRLPR